MSSITFQGQDFVLAAGETVLDCLLRHGQELPYACKSGVCQACLVKSRDKPPESACKGLKSSMQAGGYALACQWQPETDISVALPGPGEDTFAFSISLLRPLNESVMKLVLKPEGATDKLECRPGQYFSLINPFGVVRSYSVANDFAHDHCLEFHIARTAQGLFSSWLFDTAKPGDIVQARGPAGHCFYMQDASGQNAPLLLGGVGTGLAPLYGIVRNALHAGHTGPVTLLHGARNAGQLYYQDELTYLAATFANFTYLPVVREPDPDLRYSVGDVEALSMEHLQAERLQDTRVYLCGNPGFVQRLRKQIFLKGVRAGNIFCDAFIERSPA